jgi:plastocyanin
MLKMISFTVATVACLSAIAIAADMTVHQKGRVFSIETMSVKKGEAVTFFNDDNIPHNVMSSTGGNAFNLGLQPPGATTPVTFKEAGEVKVICAIHPRMKLTVTVTE